MKKAVQNLGLTVMMVMLCTAVFARKSELKIDLWNHSNFEIEIDGRCYGNSNIFQIRDLQPGRHHIKVVQKTGHYNGGHGSILYNDDILIPRDSKVRAQIKPRHRLNIIHVKRLNPPRDYNHCGTTHGNNSYQQNDYVPGHGQGNNHGQNNYDNYNGQNNHGNNNHGNNHNTGWVEVDENDEYGFGNDNHNDHHGQNNNYQNNGMDNQRFERLIKSTELQTFENNRLRVIRRGIESANSISTNQVARLMRLMTFESSKLEIAKFAYAHTADQNDYWTLYDEFTFASTANELDGFIGG